MGALADIQLAGYTFNGPRLAKMLRKYDTERIRPSRTWLTGDQRPPAEVVAKADMTETVVLGQLLRPEGGMWVILSGVPQVLRAFQTGESVTLARLSIRDTTALVKAYPKMSPRATNTPQTARALLRRRDSDTTGSSA